MKKVICLAIIVLCACKSVSVKKTTIWTIGDSTMADKRQNQYPETGWGTPFRNFFDETISVQNKAKDGYSTKMYINRGAWKSVVKDIQAGDYVFIQFGHNDESIQIPERYTPPDDFQKNLARFIEDTRNKNAFPVLITPVARRQFNSAGFAIETHPVYTPLVKEVATEYSVPLIDLDEKSMTLLNEMGSERSKQLYLILKPGEYSNYPSGVNDNTHFCDFGAQKIAKLVLEDIKTQNLSLASKITH